MILQLQQQAVMLNSMYASTALPSESALVEEIEQLVMHLLRQLILLIK